LKVRVIARLQVAGEGVHNVDAHLVLKLIAVSDNPD